VILVPRLLPKYATSAAVATLTAFSLALSFGWPLTQLAALSALAVAAPGSFVFEGLRKTGCSIAVAATALLGALLQLAFLHPLPAGSEAFLFALNVYVIAAASQKFVSDQDVRAIIVLSGALTTIQLFTVFGIIAAIFLVPVCAALAFSESSMRERSGLCTLLIFIPLAGAATRVLMPHTLAPAYPTIPPTLSVISRYILFVLLAAVAAAPVLSLTLALKRLRSVSGYVIVITAGAVILTLVIEEACFGRNNFALVIAGLVGSSIAAISSWRPTPANSYLAVASGALGVVLSLWLSIAAESFL
jgi:hypothetical protein